MSASGRKRTSDFPLGAQSNFSLFGHAQGVIHLNAQGYSADGLHGDMNQRVRDQVMNKFRKSGLEFLVATDVAARGIDVGRRARVDLQGRRS